MAIYNQQGCWPFVKLDNFTMRSSEAATEKKHRKAKKNVTQMFKIYDLTMYFGVNHYLSVGTKSDRVFFGLAAMRSWFGRKRQWHCSFHYEKATSIFSSKFGSLCNTTFDMCRYPNLGFDLGIFWLQLANLVQLIYLRRECLFCSIYYACAVFKRKCWKSENDTLSPCERSK